jgi:hypothetical protein
MPKHARGFGGVQLDTASNYGVYKLPMKGVAKTAHKRRERRAIPRDAQAR